MITRKLLAALVGLSLAAGTLGSASAQTTAPVTRSASPSDTVAPATAAKADTLKKAPVRKAHHARMTAKTRKHVSLRTDKKAGSKIAGKHAKAKHVATKSLGTKISAKLAGKRIRVSHSLKRGTTKHV